MMFFNTTDVNIFLISLLQKKIIRFLKATGAAAREVVFDVSDISY